LAHASPASGLSCEFIQELRGDVRKEAIDIHDHIDKKELRESNLAHHTAVGDLSFDGTYTKPAIMYFYAA
jgi:hypothetical protein